MRRPPLEPKDIGQRMTARLARLDQPAPSERVGWHGYVESAR
jgi:hypothetical protein